MSSVCAPCYEQLTWRLFLMSEAAISFGARFFQKTLLCISEGLTYAFQCLGALVARRPWWFIIGPVIFTALTSYGCFKIKVDGDVVKHFGPSGSSYYRIRDLIRHNFPLSHQKHYDIGRESKFFSGYGRLLMETLDEGSIFRQHIMDEILKIDKAVRSIAKKWEYEGLCAKSYWKCYVNPVITIAKKPDFLNEEIKIEYPMELSEDQLQFNFYGSALGGVTLDSKGNVINATSVQLLYFLDNVDPEKEALITTWEHSFLDLIDQIPLKYSHICKYTSNTQGDEFVKIGTDFFPLFVITGIIIAVFCTITCLSSDPLVNKPWLGVFGCISSLMGAIAGNGICLLAGLSFTPLNFSIIFLFIGKSLAYIILKSKETNFLIFFQKTLLCISEGLTYAFQCLGALVARRPWWFIIGPVIFTALTSYGCFKIKVDGDVVKHFGPSGSSYYRIRDLIRHNFPLSHQKHYDIGRESKFFSGYGRLLMETLDEGSIFRQHIMDEILKIDKAMYVRPMVITDTKGKKWEYEGLCAKSYWKCYVNPVITIAKKLEFLNEEIKIEYPMELSEDQLQFNFYGSALGGVTLDSKGNVNNATSVQLLYFLDNVDPEKEALITTWEHSFLDLIDQIPLKYSHIC
ncbi:daf-6 [Cordylochernes scorpioides]|uniref:Daf-6 n=1 Tax=Cordylochernes scorpioides TaxID=51811 RepID=A0ABY6KJN5_9ARAC|nr:daf-6 [Cordylochernes scorpioides]